MVENLGEEAPGLSTVRKWAAEFKEGRKNLEDDLRCPNGQQLPPIQKLFTVFTK